MMSSLEAVLDSYSKPASLAETLPDGRVKCLACPHSCKLSEGKRGICGVRANHGGTLMMPWGYVSGMQPDPIEKKPFAHFLPGVTTLTFGMLGCNFHCGYCQNWFTSQVLRDVNCDSAGGTMLPISPKQLVEQALNANARVIVSSYNEPFITSEWAAAVFEQACESGLYTAMVSNGYGSPKAFELLFPRLTAIKVDLKSLRGDTYRKLGGTLPPVLETIRRARQAGVWVEVVTLVVPGLNDSVDELFEIAGSLADISVDVPWHVTAFHSNYRMRGTSDTSLEALLRAAEIGEEAGLRYVYAGNLPGKVENYEDTHCPNCKKSVIKRRGYRILENKVSPAGECTNCGGKIAGVWS